MQLLVCAATEMELAPSMEFLSQHAGVRVLITGVGMTATAYALTRTVIGERPSFMIQAGVAGCLDLSLPLTRIVLVEHETIGDLGVEEQDGFHSVFDMKLVNRNEPPWTHGKLSNNLASLKQTGLTLVQGVTVNEVSTRPERIAYLQKHGAQVESMEGAAFHYVALMENIPFLQIRSLSNFAGERDKNKWVMDRAIATLNTEIQRIILKLNQ